MNSVREMKDIGNEYMPVRLYHIAVDRHNRVDLQIISGFGTEVEKEVCYCPYALPHWHTYFEMIYVMEGTADMQINNHYVRVSPGEIVLIDSGDIHNVAGECTYKVINIDPSHIFQLKNNYEDIFPKTLEGKWIHMEDTHQSIWRLLRDGIHDIFRLYEEKPHGYTLQVMGKVFELLGNIKNHGYEMHKDSFGTVVKKSDLIKLNKVLDYINNNYSQSVTIEEIAQVINLAPTYFCRFFKKNMGKTFFQYLNYYRCLQAEILLYTTDKTITDIALEVGFSSTSYFDKIYKSMKGRKPSDERKNREMSGDKIL